MSRGVDVQRRVAPKINKSADLEHTLFEDST